MNKAMSKIIALFSSENEFKQCFPEGSAEGFSVSSFYKAQGFAESFTLDNYDLMVVDFISVEFQSEADWAIQYVRLAQKSKIPILILTKSLSKSQVNHFLENGVDDFIYLPMDVHFFKKKIKELASGEFKASEELKVRANEIEEVSLKINFKLKSISEAGIELEAGAFLARGTKVKISSELIKTIFKVDTIEVVAQTYTSDKNGLYLNFCEIEPARREHINLLKLWLNENGPGSSDI